MLYVAAVRVAESRTQGPELEHRVIDCHGFPRIEGNVLSLGVWVINNFPHAPI